jgi:hypothetical protein
MEEVSSDRTVSAQTEAFIGVLLLPGTNDVLFGRGFNAPYHHGKRRRETCTGGVPLTFSNTLRIYVFLLCAGNQVFRKVLEQHFDSYFAGDDTDKLVLVDVLVDWMRTKMGV